MHLVHAGIEWYADYSRIIVVIGRSDDIPGPGQTGKCILAVGQKCLFVFSSVKRRFFQMNPAQTADKLSQSAETVAAEAISIAGRSSSSECGVLRPSNPILRHSKGRGSREVKTGAHIGASGVDLLSSLLGNSVLVVIIGKGIELFPTASSLRTLWASSK